METILVVDDNRASRDLIRAILKPVRFSIVEASNGQQALDLIHQERPDLVLLDVDMPGLDGIDGGQADSGERLAGGFARGGRDSSCDGERSRKVHGRRLHCLSDQTGTGCAGEATGAATARRTRLKGEYYGIASGHGGRDRRRQRQPRLHPGRAENTAGRSPRLHRSRHGVAGGSRAASANCPVGSHDAGA